VLRLFHHSLTFLSMKRRDNVFTSTALPDIQRSMFDLSHDVKMSFNMGELVPGCLHEALPGDKFNLNYMTMVRFAPMISPVMHKVRVKSEFFFIPNRILWDGWEDFITGTAVLEAPYIYVDFVVGEGSVADYLGVPPGDYSAQPIRVSAFPFAAYLKCYDDWYRAQSIITEKWFPLIEGDNTSPFVPYFDVDTTPLNRAWEHDYFTSALPYSQQGASEVDIPLVFEDNIPVEWTDPGGTEAERVGLIRRASTGGLIPPGSGLSVESGPSPLSSSLHADGTLPSVYDPNGTLTVDVQAEAAGINELRQAFSLQAFLERSIRGGLRYFEQMWSHFKQRSPDSRLQRPELLGRASQPVTISEVLATAQSNNAIDTAQIAVGDMAGHGISVGDNYIEYSCQEHGFILGLFSVIPDTAYQDGLARCLGNRQDRLDYAWPDFANLGEQEVYLREVKAELAEDFPQDTVFGYQMRYAEYRYEPSKVAGQFRSTLAKWTLGRIFDDPGAPPTLSPQFIECRPRFDIFAVTDSDVDHILCQIIHKNTVVRALPRYGIPSTLR